MANDHNKESGRHGAEHSSSDTGQQQGSESLVQVEKDSELYRSLGRLEGKLDALLLTLSEHVKKDEQAWERVTDLEKKIVYASGIISLIVFACTSGIWSFIKKVGLI